VPYINELHLELVANSPVTNGGGGGGERLPDGGGRGTGGWLPPSFSPKRTQIRKTTKACLTTWTLWRGENNRAATVRTGKKWEQQDIPRKPNNEGQSDSGETARTSTQSPLI